MEENFSWLVPIDIIEKADQKILEDGLPEELLIAGVASTNKEDTDGQELDPNGFNYKPFLEKGFFNLEHQYSRTKDASMLIGEPTDAFVKNNLFHVEGKLYRDNPKAVAMYKLARSLQKAGSNRKVCYSIEGNATQYGDKSKKKVSKADIFHCAITVSPKNNATNLLIKGNSFEYENQEGSEFLIDMTDENGERLVVDKSLNIIHGNDAIEKAMTAGTVTGVETIDKPLTQEPLKEESIQGATKKKKKKEVVADLTKAELFTYLIDNYKMDGDSCRNFYSLVTNIQENFN